MADQVPPAGAQPPAQPPMAQPAAQPAAQGTQRQASPQEQRKKDVIVAQALIYIHGNGRAEVLRQIQMAKDPITGIGRAAAFVETAMLQSIRDSGRDAPLYIMLRAQVEIVGDLVKLAAAEGLVEDSPRVQADAFYSAAQQLSKRLQQMQVVSPQESQQAQQEYSKVVQMGQKGQAAPPAQGLVEGRRTDNGLR